MTSAAATPPGRTWWRGNWRWGLEYWLTAYRRTWRGTITSSVLAPVLYLLAMGVGLGGYVHGGSGQVDGVRYAVYLAPGLLAASAMQTAIGETTWPVMDAIKWHKTYLGMLATPLTVVDVMVGHLVYAVLRVLLSSVIFAIVIAAFGLGHSAVGLLLAIPCAVLTGAAFAAPVAAFSVTQDKDSGFSVLYRFVMVPLFLFSGTFFPVAQLPVGLRPIAWVTPLWHGVSLCRDLVLGRGAALVLLGHVAYLLTVTALGLWVGRRNFERRLRW